MNKKGNAEKVIGSIFVLFFMIIFFSAMIPVFQSLNGQNEKDNEINRLNEVVSGFEQQLASKEVELSQLRAILESLNNTLGEKDNTISNLSGQITEKENKILELSQELESYKEKEYLPAINNNYYNILNYVDRIENKFYTLNIAISLLSLALTGIAIKIFGLDVAIKLFFKKRKEKRKITENETTNKI